MILFLFFNIAQHLWCSFSISDSCLLFHGKCILSRNNFTLKPVFRYCHGVQVHAVSAYPATMFSIKMTGDCRSKDQPADCLNMAVKMAWFARVNNITLGYILFRAESELLAIVVMRLCLQAGCPYVVWNFVNVLKNNCCLLNGELCRKDRHICAKIEVYFDVKGGSADVI